MSEVTYRQAEEKDFLILEEYYTKLNQHFRQYGYRLPVPENIGGVWLDTFRRTLGKFSMAYVAEYEGKVRGFLLARIKRLPAYMGGEFVGELSDEWIEPEIRRLGAGAHMCHMGLEWLRTQNVHSVEIQVLSGNEPSWNMLAAMGFKQEFRVGRMYWDEYIPEDLNKTRENS
jgi:RimJ/RimL family protein N-acetyltransferase